MDTKEGLDSEGPQVMMESLVCQVSPANRDLQDTRHTQGAWEHRWLKGLTGKRDPRAC